MALEVSQGMAIAVRPYGRPGDFDLVSRFLIATYRPAGGNWLPHRWDFMHYHPNLDTSVLDHIGVWEDGSRVVAVAHYEEGLGTAYLDLDPRYSRLRPEMVEYAERELRGPAPDGTVRLRVFAHEHDLALAAALEARGFEVQGRPESTSEYLIERPVPEPALPDGFRLSSLAEEDDLRKVNRVMWRGFNHPGEPPDEGVAWRARMQSAPAFRRDLNIVVIAPDGRYASYAGLWYEPANRLAMVEPVATDPDFRRLGLGRAAVFEGIRRCAGEGATAAVVGSEQKFYKALGFRVAYRHLSWVKRFPCDAE